MRIFKLFFINILILTILIYCSLLFYTNIQYDDFKISEKFGPSPTYKVEPAPAYLYKNINPKLEKLKIYDQDNDNKYPDGYWSNNIKYKQKFNVIAKFKNTDLIAYNIDYVFDRKYMRHVENQDSKTNANKFIISAGCSLTLGEGLNQGEDYPSQLAKKMNDSWKIYNFGYHGNGPNNYIDAIQKKELDLKHITENDGAFVWLFIPDHLNRYFCPLNCYNKDRDWNLERPEVEYSNGTFKAKKSFRKSYKPQRILMRVLKYFHFFDYLKLPQTQYTESEYAEFAEAVNFIPNQLNTRIKKKYFIFFDDTAGYDHKLLKEKLEKLNFKIIYLNSYLNKFPDNQRQIPGDGHPTAAINWYISEVIKSQTDLDFNP